jgi:hypothetical protein
MPSTVTIQQTVNFALTHTKLVPLVGVGGFSNEPALTIANDTLQEILSAPFNWKFNRKELQMFVTQTNKQDYLFAGAAAWVTPSSGVGSGAAIDLVSNNAITESGTTVTVNTLEPHNFAVGNTVFMFGNTVAAYNSSFNIANLTGTFSWTSGWTITAVPSATSFQFTHAQSGLAASGAPGITDMGWLESATTRDVTSTNAPQPISPATAVKMLDPSSEIGGPPEKVNWVIDQGNGILKFRVWPVPSTYPYGIQLVYQAKAPRIAALTSTWTPLPDEISNVFTQGFLAKAYRYVDANRADIEDQKFQRAISKALDLKDSETANESLYPWRSIMIG